MVFKFKWFAEWSGIVSGGYPAAMLKGDDMLPGGGAATNN